MKKSILVLLFCTAGLCSYAQINALTETGEKVVLLNDGTWQYANGSKSPTVEMKVNPKKFTKSKDASFLVKSTKTDAGVYLNPEKWTFYKAKNNPDGEYEFNTKDGSIYGMMITEVLQIPIETLANVAIENAKLAAENVTVIKKEKRTVNGQPVILMHLVAEAQGIKFFYYGYYFSTEKGSNQLVVYSGQNLFEQLESECEMFLNGLVKLEE